MSRFEHRMALWLALVSIMAAGCGNDTAIITKEPPVVEGLDPLTVGFGDTLTVSGSGFNSVLSENRIVISQGQFDEPSARRVIVPFAGSTTELRGIVPDGAFTGTARVEDLAPLAVFTINVPQPDLPSNEAALAVRLSEGEVGKAFFSGTGYEFSASAGSSIAEYLVVLFSDAVAPSSVWNYNYSITALNQTALAASGASGSSGGIDPAAGKDAENAGLAATALLVNGSRPREFERRVDEQIREIIERAGAGARSSGETPRPSLAAGSYAPTEYFKVLKDISLPLNDPDSYEIVTANLKFDGEHTLLYVDANTPPDDLTNDEAQDLGLAFDDNIYAHNRAAFGVESDINGDGKVAILMSPAVNELTDPGTASTEGFIAGYFLPSDLLPNFVPAGATNAMEIFYTIVPDPTGEWGNVFTKDKVLPIIEGVLAHEFLHMILFNYRVLVFGGGTSTEYYEDLWLEEGLAHIAEDVNGYTGSNIARAKLFLDDPGSVSLIYGGDGLEERGASFLFLRLIGDRYGEEAFKSLVQTKESGTANVETVTGEYFKELFADWSAALYLSGLGITDDPRFNYTSIDLQTEFGPPAVAAGVVSPAGMDGYVKSMAPEYILYTVPASGALGFEIGGDPYGRFNAAVVRLR